MKERKVKGRGVELEEYNFGKRNWSEKAECEIEVRKCSEFWRRFSLKKNSVKEMNQLIDEKNE